MKTVMFMRHAKSDWKQPGMADHDRPLNARGRRAAPAIACQLRDSEQSVDVILASTAERVRQTVELLQQHWGAQAEVVSSKDLYLATAEQLLRELHTLHDSWERALVVAHNPGMVSLVSHLAGQNLEMPTAAVAIFECDIDSWTTTLTPQLCRLQAYWKPRDLLPAAERD
ncbi:MAG: histidine phosphatase family protein [Planctomycetales bacterium]|nr:histidine phosphatase family protein [Planctomycetales bacterium]